MVSMILLGDNMKMEDMLFCAFLAFIFLAGSVVGLVVGAGLMLITT